MITSTILGLLLGGFGRLGIPILHFILDFFAKKYNINNSILDPNISNNCNNVCKFDPEFLSKLPKTQNSNFEKTQPKRFRLITFILVIACVGIGGVLFFEYKQAIIHANIHGSYFEFRNKLNNVWIMCETIIGAVIMWILTGSVLESDKNLFIKK